MEETLTKAGTLSFVGVEKRYLKGGGLVTGGGDNSETPQESPNCNFLLIRLKIQTLFT